MADRRRWSCWIGYDTEHSRWPDHRTGGRDHGDGRRRDRARIIDATYGGHRERVVTPGGSIDRTAASDTFRTLMLINRNIEIYLLDRQGRIVAFSAAPGSVKRQAVGLEPIRQFLSGADVPIVVGI